MLEAAARAPVSRSRALSVYSTPLDAAAPPVTTTAEEGKEEEEAAGTTSREYSTSRTRLAAAHNARL